MKIIVKAKPLAKQQSVELLTQPTLGFGDAPSQVDVYKVCVKEPPVDGKSNQAISKALAEYFKISQSQVRLVSGRSSKQKIFEIDL